MTPGLSNVTPISSITPLLVVLGATAIKEAVEDARRGRTDKQVNNRPVKVIDRQASREQRTEVLVTKTWKDLAVSDIVKLEKDDMVPADLLILGSSLPQGLCFLETANLDGETNLKIYQALEQTVDVAQPESIGQLKLTLKSELPNNRLYVFEGSLQVHEPVASSDLSVSAKQILLRGCVLRNTPWVYGLVVFTGFDTKLMKNQTAAPSKRSSLEILMNDSLLLIFLFMFAVVFVSALFSQLNVGSNFWYIHGDRDDDNDGVPDNTHFAFKGNIIGFFFNFGSFTVLYSSMIPISLYVTMEICKLFQAWMMLNDEEMYYEPKDQPALVRTSNLTEELGQIEYIFSDKTGTLTCNSMVFHKCSVAGFSYDVRIKSGGSTVDKQKKLAAGKRPRRRPLSQRSYRREESVRVSSTTSQSHGRTSGNATSPSGSGPPSPRGTADASAASPTEVTLSEESKLAAEKTGDGDSSDDGDDPDGDHDDAANLADLSQTTMLTHLRAPDARGDMLDGFWTLLAVCHTVIPENPDPETGLPQSYQAESPDELALVLAAKEQGFTLMARAQNSVTILNHGEKEEYKLLNINDFNSTRKRMSAVFQCPDGRILLMVKGADSMVKPRLSTKRVSKAQVRTVDNHLDRYSRAGLRTLLCAQRELDKATYEAWNKRYHAASIAVENRGQKMDDVAEQIEKDLDLLGATAIEDRLQDGVPETIANLGKAGIKLWVLTGDKVETAINIARSCNLIGRGMTVSKIVGPKPGPLLADVIDRLGISLDDLFGSGGGVGIGGSNLKMASGGSSGARSPRGGSRSVRSMRSGNTAAAASGTGISPKGMALVLDGAALEQILGNKQFELQLLLISTRVRSVVCCRVSPLQKSLVVRLVRENLAVRTLAIGDGANDVSMIQAAQVGIGISGNEGMQAVMASDYAIAQFRFLETLLLVHGRWNYKRVSKLVLYSFYKNMAYILTQFWFNMFSANNSAQNLFDSWVLSVFNLLFTALPVMVYAILEQDVPRSVVRAFPQLYESGLYNYEYNRLLVWTWVGNAVYTSSVMWFGCRFAFDEGQWSPDGRTDGLWVLGNTVMTVVVLVVNLKLALDYQNWTWIHHFSLYVSIGAWFVYASIYSVLLGVTEPSSFYWSMFRLVTIPNYWLTVVIVSAICLIPDLAYKFMQRMYVPENYQIAQELARLRDARGAERRGEQIFTDSEKEQINMQFGDMVPIQKKFQSAVVELQPIKLATRGGRRIAELTVGGERKRRGYDLSSEKGMVDALRILKYYKPKRNQEVPERKKHYQRPSVRSIHRAGDDDSDVE